MIDQFDKNVKTTQLDEKHNFSIRYTEKSAVVDEEDPEDSGEI